MPAHEIVGKGLVQVTQGKDVFPAMSVTENLKLGGFILKSKQQLSDNLEKVYNYFPRLVKMGYLKNNNIKEFFEDFKSLEILPYSRIFCPILIEIIAEK